MSASITFNTSNKAKGEITEKQSPVVEHHEESQEGQESSWGGGGQRRTGNVLVCEEKRQTRQRFSKNSLVCEIPAVETGSQSHMEGVGRGELPIPPMNYVAVKQHTDTFLKVHREPSH